MDCPRGLPRELATMTPSQEESVIKYLATKATGRLRQMQRVVQSQIPMASKAKNNLALSNLQIMDNNILAAIWKKTEL